MAKTNLDRFWSRVDKRGAMECWNWQHTCDRYGYGMFWDGKRLAKAHRIAYEALRGPIPDGLQCDHLCRNRACVNPEHIEPVIQAVNLARGEGIGAKYAVRTHCIRGHEFTPENLGKTKRTGRLCKQCNREKCVQRKTHCKYGHELSGANVFIRGRWRVCVTCEKERYGKDKNIA